MTSFLLISGAMMGGVWDTFWHQGSVFGLLPLNLHNSGYRATLELRIACCDVKC